MTFSEFLCEQGHVTGQQLSQLLAPMTGRPDTIGAIGLRLGLLSLDEIDDLLDEQAQEHRLFGRLAVDKGYLTAEQVDGLLAVQQLDCHLDVGKALVVAGLMTPKEMIDAVGLYLTHVPAAASV